MSTRQSYPLVLVVIRHVGQDDLVARLQAVDDLDRADGAATEFHVHPDRFAVRPDLEEADRAVLLAERRPSDVEHVLEQLQPDGAVDAEIGTRTSRERT